MIFVYQSQWGFDHKETYCYVICKSQYLVEMTCLAVPIAFIISLKFRALVKSLL